jgi:hypothetical protein
MTLTILHALKSVQLLCAQLVYHMRLVLTK